MHDDKYMCDLAEIECTGKAPSPRTSHCAVLIRARHPPSGILPPALPTSPSPSTSTAAMGAPSCAGEDSSYRKKMLVFGGFYESNYHNDLWELDLNTLHWRQIEPLSTAPVTASTSTVPLLGKGAWPDSSVNNSLKKKKKKGRTKRKMSGRPHLGMLGLSCILDEEIDFPNEEDEDEDEEEEQDEEDGGEGNTSEDHDDNNSINNKDEEDGEDEDAQQVPWPLPRAAHAAAVRPTPDGDRVIIFGGQIGKTTHIGDFWEYDYDRNMWHEIKSKNRSPSPRSFHTMIYRPNTDSVVIFCGQDMSEGVMCDMWEYSFETQRWEMLMNEVVENVQQCEHAFSLGSRMAIMESYDQVKICVFDFNSLKWITLSPQSESIPYRFHFVGELLGNRAAVLFGGRDEEQKLFNDLHIFDIATQRWHKIRLKDESLRHRLKVSFCSCIPIDKTSMLIFGGKQNDTDRTNKCFRLTFSEKVFSETIMPPDSFQQKLSELMQSELLSDITLVSNDGRRFNMHRAILALFVPYFNMLFTSDYRDSNEKEMILEEVDGDTLELILNYVYGKKSKVSSDSLQRLSKLSLAANMLMMQPLLNICMEKMAAMIDDDNVTDVFKFSCAMGDAGKTLANRCMQRMSRTQLQNLVLNTAQPSNIIRPAAHSTSSGSPVLKKANSRIRTSGGNDGVRAAGPSPNEGPSDSIMRNHQHTKNMITDKIESDEPSLKRQKR